MNITNQFFNLYNKFFKRDSIIYIREEHLECSVGWWVCINCGSKTNKKPDTCFICEPPDVMCANINTDELYDWEDYEKSI